jgi:tol-pal system protein YbgF
VTSLRGEVQGARATATDAVTRATAAEQRARDLEASLRDVDRVVHAQRDAEGRLRARLAHVEDALARMQGERRRRADAAPSPAEADAPPPRADGGVPPPSAVPAVPPESAYASALARFRADEHAQAVLDFRDFVARHPRHPLAANAQYWIGEAYFAAREWRQALAEFQAAIDRHRASGKSADAWFMIGRCLAHLNESGAAQAAWERVVRDYPLSTAATHAQRWLRTSRPPPAPGEAPVDRAGPARP